PILSGESSERRSQVYDLKSELVGSDPTSISTHFAPFWWLHPSEPRHASGPIRLRPTHGPPAARCLSSRGPAPSGAPLRQALLVSRSVPLHGLCAAHGSREPARYRAVPTRPSGQALPPWHPRSCRAQHAGRRKREARLADL